VEKINKTEKEILIMKAELNELQIELEQMKKINYDILIELQM
jgi:hypothetical protein